VVDGRELVIKLLINVFVNIDTEEMIALNILVELEIKQIVQEDKVLVEI
jgi:hypothetical protein